MKIKFTQRATRSIKKLEISIQSRIKKKLKWLLQQEDPIQFADFLTDSELGQFRFRVGDYRIIFDVQSDTIIVHLVGHRKNIY